MSEHVEVELDDRTAGWVRSCAHRRGVDVAEAIAAQLREAREAELAAAEEYLTSAATERHDALYA